MPKAYVIRDLVDLDPERVVLCRDEWGDPDGLEYDGLFLGEESIALASFLPEFQNWYGTSILEGAYEPWFEAQHTRRYHSHWNEQKSNPPYIGYAPDDGLAQQLDAALDGQGKNPLEVIARAGMSLREGGIAALPAAFDERGNRLWSLEELDTTNRTADFLAHRRYLDDMQLRGMLVPERTVSQEGVGSYAMADAHVGVFLGLMEEIRVDLVLATLNRIVRRLVRANFGRHAACPVVESSELNRQSKALLAAIVEKTLDVGRVTAEGVPYTTAQIIDDIAALEALNIPHRRPRDVVPEPADASPAPTPLDREPSPEDLLRYPHNPAQVAEALGLSAATVRGYASRRGAPCLRLPGGRLRFNAEEFSRWLREPEGEAA